MSIKGERGLRVTPTVRAATLAIVLPIFGGLLLAGSQLVNR